MEYLIIARDDTENGFWGICIAVLGLRWGLRWSGLVDMAILDRYEIGCSQKIAIAVIFEMKFLILAMKKEMQEKLFLGYMH